MLRIKKIAIKNFRSIDNLTLDCSNITTFVGLNDAGKSNILRALNLFFNNETDHSLNFDFSRDYNLFAQPKINKAKEIVVELLIKLPETYVRPEYPEDILWKKVWRANGQHSEGCFYKYSNKEEFPPRSRIPLLLERIVYNYVPAIKDKSFFADLQGKVYDVLQTVAEKKLRDSATSFEKEIQGHLSDLLFSVSGVFNSDNDMRLPENLRQIFETLEFNSNGIPLSRRGDGIKVRHIPMILRFIAEKRNSIHNQGVSHHIWGFEEPENNVEMAASFDLAKQFLEASEESYQIFLTTHSPVFYGLAESHPQTVKAYRVSKENDFSKPQEINKLQMDHEIGLMQLVTPYVNQELKDWLKKKEELEGEIEKLKSESEADKSIPHIFVEGQSDEIVLNKAIKVFYPELVELVKVYSGGQSAYGSADAAANRLIAWQLIQQHHSEPVKACLILDKDEAGIGAKAKLQSQVTNKNKHVKAFFWEINGKPLGIENGFELAIDLEYLYTDELWDRAEKANWLELRKNPNEMLTDSKQKEILRLAFTQSQLDLFAGLDENVQRRIKTHFMDESKIKVAKWLDRCGEHDAKRYLANFECIIKKAFEYLELVKSE